MSLLEERLMVTPAFTGRPMTIDDLATLPDDGNRYEVIGGELFVSPAPSLRHQYLVGELFKQLSGHVNDQRLGVVFAAPVEVQLSPHDVVQPDVVVVLRHRLDRLQELRIVGAPDLVIEVISPGSRGTDLVRKAALYASHEVQEYWVVDPEAESILVQAHQEGRFVPVAGHGGRLRSRTLPGFEVNEADFFAPPSWLTREERN
jgi:Uma2 family endonuclease